MQNNQEKEIEYKEIESLSFDSLLQKFKSKFSTVKITFSFISPTHYLEMDGITYKKVVFANTEKDALVEAYKFAKDSNHLYDQQDSLNNLKRLALLIPSELE